MASLHASRYFFSLSNSLILLVAHSWDSCLSSCTTLVYKKLVTLSRGTQGGMISSVIASPYGEESASSLEGMTILLEPTLPSNNGRGIAAGDEA